MADFTERLRLLIEANTSGAIKDLESLGTGAEVHVGGKGVKALEAFAGSGSKVTGALGKVQDLISSIPAPVAIASAGFAAAGLAIAKFALDGVEHFSDLTGKVLDFQRVTGASAEDSSKLVLDRKSTRLNSS